MMLVSSEEATLGHLVPTFPAPDGVLSVSKFFDALYQAYNLRYVYAAKLL